MENPENSKTSPNESSAAAPNSAPSPAAHEEQSDPVQALKAQLKEQESKYLYLYAEFDNFKKRALKERSDTLKFGFEGPLREWLSIFDNFERAMSHAPAQTDTNWLAGVKMVQKQMADALEKQGVKAIATVGAAFDANLHEAVGQAPSEGEAGRILHEEQKGYTLHGRLLRAARVIVSVPTGAGVET